MRRSVDQVFLLTRDLSLDRRRQRVDAGQLLHGQVRHYAHRVSLLPAVVDFAL